MTADRATGTTPTLPDLGRSRLLPACTLAAVALVGALVWPLPDLPVQASGPRAPRSSASPAPAATGAARLLATPLLSPARVPRTLQGLRAKQQLSDNLKAALSAKRLGVAGAAKSCAEVAQDGWVLFADHPSMPVVPASNMKLLTATAVLDELGASYTFRTTLEAAAAPVDGVVSGDLYLVGSGDPLLRLPRYAAHIMGGDKVFTSVTGLVAQLKAAGAREVTGSVVGDDSRYDSMRSVPGWPSRYAAEGDVGQLTALDIDDGFALGGAPLRPGTPPAQQAAALVAQLLRKAGVSVDGAAISGPAPSGLVKLAVVTSAPLGQLLGEVLRESDNTATELLTKELGRSVSGVGSTAADTAAVRAVLKAHGLSVNEMVNTDGSGLAPTDRLTCATLLGVLEQAGPKSLLVEDLPVAGRSGTLAGVLKGTPAAGRVRAKTGTLDHVKALSGWVAPRRGQGGGNPALAQPVVFATVLNGLPLSFSNPKETSADLTDQVAIAIAEYPKAPALAKFEP